MITIKASLPRSWTPPDIRELRRRAGLTQEQFARLLGLTLSAVYRWESSNPAYARRPRGLSLLALDNLQRLLDSQEPEPNAPFGGRVHGYGAEVGPEGRPWSSWPTES